MTIDDIPTVSFEDISAEYATRGIDLRDMLSSSGHFERWMRAAGLPETDAEGRHWRSSGDYMARYRSDPAGEAAEPAYVDFWHFLIEFGERTPWIEGRCERRKDVPIGAGAIVVPADPTREELDAGRARLQALSPEPIPDHAWRGVERDALQRRIRIQKAVEVVADVAARHGVDHPQLGRIVRIGMKVDC